MPMSQKPPVRPRNNEEEALAADITPEMDAVGRELAKQYMRSKGFTEREIEVLFGLDPKKRSRHARSDRP